MVNRIFIIHTSEIIRWGLFTVVKNLFDIESVLLSNADELKNYSEIANVRIIILTDSGIDEQHLTKMLNPLRSANSVKILLIRKPGEETACAADCDCCFTLDAPKSKISDLLAPYLQKGNYIDKKRNSASLTEREIDVIKLVALGKTNKEIANELCISIHTVISHRKNITEKLGIKSISGLTVYAILNNLIDASTIDPESLI